MERTWLESNARPPRGICWDSSPTCFPLGSPQGVPPAGPQMKANAANIKATVLATCSLLLTLAGRPLHWLLLELRIPHPVSCGFSSFLCKLCININIFLTLQILKFIKGKCEIRFFHEFIFFNPHLRICLLILERSREGEREKHLCAVASCIRPN